MSIMNHKKSQLEKGTSQEMEYRFKISLFNMMHNIISNNLCNTLIYCVLLTIENLQLMYYPIHPVIDFLWTNQGLDYFRIVLRYFQFNYLIDQGVSIFLILLYISFGVMIIIGAIFFTAQYTLSQLRYQEQPSGMLNFSFKLLSLLLIILNTILALPFYNIFLATIYCRSDSAAGADLGCYAGIHILHMIVAIIGIVLLVFFHFSTTLLYFDLNPKSKFPFNGYQSDAEYARMLFKFVTPFLIIFNAPGTYNSEMVVLFGVGDIILLFSRYNYPTGYNNLVHFYKIALELIVLWVNVCVIITDFLDTGSPDDMGLLYLFVLIPCVVFGGLYAFKLVLKESMTFSLKTLKNEEEADNYLNTLIQLILQRNQPNKRIKLMGMLKLHFISCNKVGCICKQLISNDHKKEETHKDHESWMKFVMSILDEIMADEKFKENARFKIFYSYFSNDELHNKYNGLHYMMKAEDTKNHTLRDEFCLYRFKMHIESEMQEDSEKQQDIDVNSIVFFQNQLVVLTTMIQKSAESHLEFWRELQEDHPNILKLQNIGMKVLHQVDQCDESYQELAEINNNNLNLLEFYQAYLEMVVHDKEQHEQLAQTISQIKKTIYQRKQGGGQESKITESQETVIITMSGNVGSIGIVASCNNEIQKSLGYPASELFEQNVSKIMPKIIGDQHNQLVENYMRTSSSNIIGLERFVLAQNSQQYLVPCKLMVKVLPNLEKGILLVGFLKPLDKVHGTHYMIYDGITQQILNVSESMKDLGIRAEDIATTSAQEQPLYTFGNLFKELGDVLNNTLNQNDQPLKNQIYKLEGDVYIAETTIDVQLFRQLLQSNLHDSDNKKMGNSIKDSAIMNYSGDFKKVKVRLELIEERYPLTEDGQPAAGGIYHTIVIREDMDQEKITNNNNNKSLIKQKLDESRQIRQQQSIEEQVEEKGKGMQSEDQDENKQVKDIRSALEQSKTPRQIIYLRYLTLVLFLSTVGLSISKLVLALQQTILVDEGVSAVRQAHRRHSLMADINLYSRYLQLTSFDYYDSSMEGAFKANISVLVDKLQTIQFDMIEYRIKVESRSGLQIDDDSYDVVFLLSNNETKTYSNIFNDAVFAYITSASSFKKATLSQFNDSTNSSNVAKNFFYVVENGLDVLRNGSERIADKFYNFYYDQVDSYSTNAIIILITALVIIVLCEVVYIPIFMSIFSERKRLISYFGMISNEDLKILIDSGDKFIIDHISKFKSNDDLNAQEQQHIVESSLNHSQEQAEESPKPQKVEIEQRKSLFDQNKEKDQRIYESKGGTHYFLVFSFIFIGSLLMVEYIVMYVLETQSITDAKLIMDHYLYISRRASIIKYNILFTLEAMVNNGQPRTYQGNDLSKYYNEKVYANEQDLFKTLTFTYPSSFDPYFLFFNNVNFLNVCEHITWINSLSLITQSFIFTDTADNFTDYVFKPTELNTECNTVKGGLLTKGLRDAIFLVSLGNNELLATFTDLSSGLGINAFLMQERLRKYILPTFWENNNIFQICFYDFLDIRDQMQIYNFVGFICFLILVFLFLWFSYIAKVQSGIQQSMRMLTLIPDDLIDKYTKLKDEQDNELNLYMFNPVEQYYSNDHYLYQLTKPESARTTNTSYSPKKLIMGYWKKDYKTFIKQRTLNLESKEIQSHEIKHKQIKQSFTRLAETILNVSNCFENIPNRQTKTDRFVQKLKIHTPSPTPPKLHNHEIHKIPGRLYKGSLLKNLDNSYNHIDKSYILDSKQEFGQKTVSPKPQPLSRQEEVRQKPKQISTSTIQSPQLKLLIRRSTMNSNVTIKKTNPLDVQGMKMECLLSKPCPNNINNLVIIQFENVLGYDESSYFGLQSDFIGTKQYEEYLILRDHYFQKVSPTFYVHKNIKELFNSISRVYQIALYTINYPDLLRELMIDKKLKVNGIYQILDYKIDTFVVDISEILKIVTNSQLLIFIQPFHLLNQQQSFIAKHNKLGYYEYYGQRFFIPFSPLIHPNNYRLLALPQLNMQSLYKTDEQSKGFVQINYFIEQFTLALQSEGNFNQFLTKSQNKIKCINQASYFRQQKQKLLQQLYFIDTLKQSSKQDGLRLKKKEMAQRIIHKLEYNKQVEIITNDLIHRNKDIFKKIRNYKQETINTLKELYQEFTQQLIRLNYCEMFVDTCYYLPY